MKVRIRLNSFTNHSPDDSVEVWLPEDGTWLRVAAHNFDFPGSGVWDGTLTQETNLKVSRDALPFCILQEFNLKSLGPIPNVGDRGALIWRGETHTEVTDGEWTVVDKSD